MHEQRVRRKVEYVDTDMSGIVHFSRFLVFMENAEHAFLKAVGPGVQWRDGEGRELGWPRVAVSCDYLSPARFGDELEIRVRVLRKGTRSLTYGFEITRGGTALAKGEHDLRLLRAERPLGDQGDPDPRGVAARIEAAHPREGD